MHNSSAILRVLLAVPLASRRPLLTALAKAGATPEPVEELTRGLHDSHSRFDVAVLDGAAKSLSLRWAIGELRKRDPAVRIFTLGGDATAETVVLDPSTSPEVLAARVTNAQVKRHDFLEISGRAELRPLFSVTATRAGATRWIVGTEVEKSFEAFAAIANRVAAVPSCAALPALLEHGHDDACAWAAFAPLPLGCAFSDLNRLLRHEAARLSMGTLLHLGVQVCEALSVLHRAHVRHGMVRPYSVWLPDQGEPMLRLAGFGQLIDADRFSNHRVMFGGLRRIDDLSPEQFLAHQPGDHRTDLYQLGYFLFESLAGRTPFELTPHDRRIPALNTSLPRPISQTVTALLARDPATRPTLSETHAALMAFAAPANEALAEIHGARGRLRALLEL